MYVCRHLPRCILEVPARLCSTRCGGASHLGITLLHFFALLRLLRRLWSGVCAPCLYLSSLPIHRSSTAPQQCTLTLLEALLAALAGCGMMESRSFRLLPSPTTGLASCALGRCDSSVIRLRLLSLSSSFAEAAASCAESTSDARNMQSPIYGYVQRRNCNERNADLYSLEGLAALEPRTHKRRRALWHHNLLTRRRLLSGRLSAHITSRTLKCTYQTVSWCTAHKALPVAFLCAHSKGNDGAYLKTDFRRFPSSAMANPSRLLFRCRRLSPCVAIKDGLFSLLQLPPSRGRGERYFELKISLLIFVFLV